MKFPSIRIEGAILAGDILDKIEGGDVLGQKPAEFGMASNAKVKDEIIRAWTDAQDLWRIFRRKLEGLKPEATATSETRNFFVVPLLGLLGYQIELAGKGEVVNDKNYPISHRVPTRDGFPIHIMGWRDSLDKKREDSGPRMSPHALVQEYLNLTEHLYAIVTNGQQLRLLRDSSRLIKLSFLEFDLRRIFEEELFADFALLYRLLHVSRMPLKQDAAAESIIERYHQDSLDSGSRIRDGLSKAVEDSIKSLANGFLNHAQNQTLKGAITGKKVTATEFYKWQLRLIYRLLFLMVTEERDLIFPKNSDRKQRGIYYRYYSLNRLRKLSEKRHFADKNFQDAWAALKSNFRLFQDGPAGKKLGIAPLAGDLFGYDAIGLLNECQLDNQTLLECFRNLSTFDPEPKHLIENASRLLVGTHYLGDGFVIPAAQAKQVIEAEPDYSNILFPLFNCDELNNSYSHIATRYIINFHTWPESKARDYPLAFQIVEERVRPEREKESGRLKKCWWLFKRPYTEIEELSRGLDRFFACGITTKHLCFSALSPDHVLSHAACVLVTDRWDLFAIVQCSIHECWARKQSGAHELRLRYSPSNCFETFPHPLASWEKVDSLLEDLGYKYHSLRRSLMLTLMSGLTDLYNLLHSRDLSVELVAKESKQPVPVAESAHAELLQLRALHVQMDQAVLAAYGWHQPSDAGPALALRHDFYEVDYLPENDRVRYTIHPDARKEILKRLLQLNHKLYAEEEAKGLHKPKKAGKKAKVEERENQNQPTLGIE